MTTLTAGPNSVILDVTNPLREDFGGLMVWVSTVNGFAPGPANLKLDHGPDLLYELANLAAGIPIYVRYCITSLVDPLDFTETSAQLTATPLAPSVKADDILVGTMRGSNAFAGSFGTKGSTLTANTLAAAVTIPIQNSVDFTAPGSAVIFSPTAARDFDIITYTGKTATSLTGVSGALAHSDGEVIIPLTGKSMTIDANVGEMRFYGDGGAGVELLAAIGINTVEADTVIGKFGSPSTTHTALRVESDSATYTALFYGYGDGPAIAAGKSYLTSTGPTARFENYNGDAALVLSSGADHSGGATGGVALKVEQPGKALIGARSGPQVNLEPGFGNPNDAIGAAGDLTMGPNCDLYVHKGAAWRQIYAEGDTILAESGSAAAPSYSWSVSQDEGMYRKSGSSIGWSTSGVERMYLDATGLHAVALPDLGLGTLTPSPLLVDNLNNDTINLSGFYETGAATTGTNPIAAGHLGFVQHFLNGNRGVQMFVSYTTGRMFIRPRAGAAWGVWKEWLDEDDMVAILAACGTISGTQTWTGSNSFSQAVALTGGYTAAAVNYDFQPAHTTKNAAATLTGAELLSKVIRWTGGAANLTLPTAAAIDTATGLGATNRSFDVDVVNNGTGICTIVVGAGITLALGVLTIAINDARRLRFRRTGAGAYSLMAL